MGYAYNILSFFLVPRQYIPVLKSINMKSLIIANWKMNPATAKEAKKLFEETKRIAGFSKGLSVIVAPPSIFLREVCALLRGGKVGLAAQNLNAEAQGSFTGEISIPQARDAKVSHVLIGHAERRAMGETNEDTRAKVAAALAAKLTPVLCIGEKTRTSHGEHFAYVKEQLRVGLMDVAPAKISKIIIAYEPVWAIGAKEAMHPSQMHEMSIFIRKMIVEKFGDAGMNITILYGGSIDAKSAPAMMQGGDVKGLLVGRVSIDAKAFTELLRTLSAI